MRILGVCLAVIGPLLFGAVSHAASTEQSPIVVFAAASLTNVLQELGDQFMQSTSTPVKFSFAASSTLARQIENGAPADLFFSADTDWMDYLQSRHLIQTASRQVVAANHLVLVAPAGAKLALKIIPGFALAAALGEDRLATGDPDSVPVGRYAREALMKLGVWDSVQRRLVRTENVRAALAFVERGEVALGIVYRTDALIDPKVRIVDVFPDDSHAPIAYPVALTSAAQASAIKFMEYLRGPTGREAFRKYGFEPLP